MTLDLKKVIIHKQVIVYTSFMKLLFHECQMTVLQFITCMLFSHTNDKILEWHANIPNIHAIPNSLHFLSCNWSTMQCILASPDTYIKYAIQTSVHPSVYLSVCQIILAVTKQLYEWFSPSVCLSVCHTFVAATKQLYEWFSPSFCHTFFTMFPSLYHHEILRG